MAYDRDDDDDEGPGFLSTALLLSLTAGGAWFLYKSLTNMAAAAETAGLPPTATPGQSILSALTPIDIGLNNLLNITGAASPPSATTGQGMPLGIANNNPGNIRWSAANNWEGQTGQDAHGFATFSDPVYGIRAMYKLLAAYQNEIQSGQGVFDILSISRQWTETQQDAWAANVAAASGISQTTPLDASNAGQMQAIVNGIVVAENGGGYSGYYSAEIPQAWAMA